MSANSVAVLRIALERANMRSWMVFTLLSASLLMGQPAWAAKHQSRERQAKKACLSGDYGRFDFVRSLPRDRRCDVPLQPEALL